MTKRNFLNSTTAMVAVAGGVLAAGAAQAATASFTTVSVAQPSVVANGGNIAFSTANVLAVSLANGGGETINIGGSLTVTLPTGWTWIGTPSAAAATPTNCNAGAFTLTPSTATNVLTVTVTGNNIAPTGGNNCVINIGGVTPMAASTGTTVSGAAVGTNFTATVGAAPNGGTFTALTTQPTLVTADRGIVTTGTAASAGLTIDTGSASIGRNYVVSNGGLSARVGTLGTVQVAASGQNAAGVGSAYAPGGAGNFVVSGSFTGVSRAYVATATCSTTVGSTPTGFIAGTISGGAATFNGLTLGQSYNVCLENNGTSVLVNSAYSSTATVSSVAGVTAPAVALVTTAYNGLAQGIDYVTGGSAYQYFVRVTNPTSGSATVAFVVIKDDGSSFSGATTTALGANANALWGVDVINAATGANLTAADRARLVVLAPAGATAGSILFNTATGVVVRN